MDHAVIIKRFFEILRKALSLDFTGNFNRVCSRWAFQSYRYKLMWHGNGIFNDCSPLPLSWTSFIQDWRILLICYILLFADCKLWIGLFSGTCGTFRCWTSLMSATALKWPNGCVGLFFNSGLQSDFSMLFYSCSRNMIPCCIILTVNLLTRR